MKEKTDGIVLRELSDNTDDLNLCVSIEHALVDIRDTFQTPSLAKIPFTEIAALGGSFASVVHSLSTPAGEGIYRCVFPNGIKGTLAMAKDGSGALGTIVNETGFAGQARWIPVEKAIGPEVIEAALIAVAVLAVVKQINDIKDGQKAIIEILERDKKSQLLADYDILSSLMEDYQFYWENEAELVVNLNQVKNIKRNAMKDVRSYEEQIKGLVTAKKNLLKMKTASQKIGEILERFVHYKLALNVYALSQYMEVMLSKNFQTEYLQKLSNEIRDCAYSFRELYTLCYDKIELLKTEAIATQVANNIANVSQKAGKFIEKIPVVSKGPVDEFLIGVGDLISEAEKEKMKKTISFFMQYKDSGIISIAEHIDLINNISNRPMLMVYDKKVIQFHELKDVV